MKGPLSLLAVLLSVCFGICNAHGATKGDILVILSASDHLTLKDGSVHPTGYFLSELITPVTALTKNGYKITIATPGGIAPTVDASSDNAQYFRDKKEYDEAKAFQKRLSGLKRPVALKSLTNERLARFDAVFFPGGHAPLEDLAKDADVKRILNYFHAKGKPTALICHGPAALLSTVGKGNVWIYKGYKMTAFSTEEERVAESGALKGGAPYYLDQALKNAGGVVVNAKPWTANAIRDRELITAQNPMSDRVMVEKLLAALR